ncbi:hypothetical protein J7T55_015758 [Diaporthe amygdali]|uniref:uncharacterized protein n=1 Tax=Phomopsis amygdali TaxID=1214568 RepID=UPI0022FE6715|nr:uncharacterized protein J7T55_015758 [Diaporthe amygdali]KAJ0107293.1 hypothetical protein J7T55_015758 [Diaporthe amygdali]
MSQTSTTQLSLNEKSNHVEKNDGQTDPERSTTEADSVSPGTFENGNNPESGLHDGPASPPLSEPKRSITGIRWLLVCVAIFSANILYGLDTTIVADIQGTISTTFNNVTQLGWLGIGFTLGSTVAILPLGKAFGIFDNKWIFVGSLIHFAAASALCGAAPNMQAMIVGRVWAGVGGAGMYLGTLNLVTVLSVPKEQPFYIALTGFSYGSGCILGPLVGGALADSPATWRWAFYLNLCVFGALSPIYLFLLPSLPRRPDSSFIQHLRALDWLGMMLTVGLYVSFTLAFTFGGVIWAWSDGRTIALIVVFGVLTIAFVITQRLALFTNTMDRLFPCDLVADPQLVLLYIIMACGGATLFVSLYYIPLYFLFVYGDGGVQAAVRLLPYICFYVATILFCGACMSRTGWHNLWFLVSGMCLVAGGATMYTIKIDTPLSNLYGFISLLGLGMATSQAGYAVGNHLVREERAAELIQFLNISQGQSQLIGLVIASSVFQTQAFSGLESILGGRYSDADIRAAVAGAQSIIFEQLDEDTRRQCLVVIVNSIGSCWTLVIAAGATYTICSAFLSRNRVIQMDKEKAVQIAQA